MTFRHASRQGSNHPVYVLIFIISVRACTCQHCLYLPAPALHVLAKVRLCCLHLSTLLCLPVLMPEACCEIGAGLAQIPTLLYALIVAYPPSPHQVSYQLVQEVLREELQQVGGGRSKLDRQADQDYTIRVEIRND